MVVLKQRKKKGRAYIHTHTHIILRSPLVSVDPHLINRISGYYDPDLRLMIFHSELNPSNDENGFPEYNIKYHSYGLIHKSSHSTKGI